MRHQETFSSADPEPELIVEEPIGTTTLKYQIVQVLRDNILAGKLSPGQRLNESRLARTLGMSRIPVREALQRLEEQGLVVNVQRKGMFVVQLTEEEVQKINSLRLILEAEALILCRTRLTPEIERALTDLVEQWEREVPKWPQSQAAELDLEIHRTIWTGTGNEYLVKTMSSLIVPLFAYRVIRKLNVETQRWGHNTHLPLLDYVMGKSKLSAEQVMLEHLRFGWEMPERFSSLGLRSET
jgi:DNA-binding GntR family transcriptional regulator